MSVFTSLIILVLATLIQSLLWLTPGVFAIFYHHSLGTTTAKKADDRSLSFIIGTEITTVLFFFVIYSITIFLVLENNLMHPIFFYVMAGLLLASALLAFFTYSRRPKILTHALIYHAEHAKNRTDTIVLGLITPALELLVTLPLYIICIVAVFNLSMSFGFIFAIIYTIAATLPLFIIRTTFRTSHNLADLLRFHKNHELLLKTIILTSFIIIAITVFIIGLNRGGII